MAKSLQVLAGGLGIQPPVKRHDGRNLGRKEMWACCPMLLRTDLDPWRTKGNTLPMLSTKCQQVPGELKNPLPGVQAGAQF